MTLRTREGQSSGGGRKAEDMTGSEQAKWVRDLLAAIRKGMDIGNVRESDRRLIMRRMAREIKVMYG